MRYIMLHVPIDLALILSIMQNIKLNMFLLSEAYNLGYFFLADYICELIRANTVSVSMVTLSFKPTSHRLSRFRI